MVNNLTETLHELFDDYASGLSVGKVYCDLSDRPVYGDIMTNANDLYEIKEEFMISFDLKRDEFVSDRLWGMTGKVESDKMDAPCITPECILTLIFQQEGEEKQFAENTLFPFLNSYYFKHLAQSMNFKTWRDDVVRKLHLSLFETDSFQRINIDINEAFDVYVSSSSFKETLERVREKNRKKRVHNMHVHVKNALRSGISEDEIVKMVREETIRDIMEY